MKGVVVIGGHVQGLGIVRQFGRNNIRCFVLDESATNIARHSKYCERFLKICKDNDFINFLISINHRYNLQDWLLIATDDYYVRILSQNKTVLEDFYKISVDDWAVVKNFYFKRLTYRRIIELGIEMPQTFFPDTLEDLERINPDYPCIIKPSVMHSLFSQIRRKVLVCRNKQELIQNYVDILKYIPKDEVIVQEFIPGGSDNQYSACFFFNREKPLISLLARRKRQHPIDFGNATTFAETINDNELLEKAIAILASFSYWGLCEVEFKKDIRDGKYKFLEVNPRTWKWHSIANKSGSPFLMSLYNYIYTGNGIIKNTWNDACWKDVTTDVYISLKLLMSGKFKKSPHKPIEYAIFDIHDAKPFLFELLYIPYLIISRT